MKRTIAGKIVPDTLKIVKVFIGSPGGLEIERNLAKRIVDDINQSHSEHWGCQIQLIGWEATLPGYSRAQSLINQDLDKCEYFVGIIWNRWGSPPSEGDSQYTSGFEEEYERAKTNFENGTMKDIALYFKDIPAVQLDDLGPSVTKVIAFRDQCIEQRKPFFKPFKEPSDFEPLLRAKLSEIGWKEFNRHASSGHSSDPEGPARDRTKEANAADETPRLIGPSAAEFLTGLLQRTSDWDATTRFDVARLRLIGTTTWRQGNDEIYTGNHDANLLFLKRGSADYSMQELRALLDTGIAGFHHQNVPLWYWLSPSTLYADARKRIGIVASVGNPQERINAIKLLQCLREGTPQDVFDREALLRRWLVGVVPTQDLTAALDFLKTNGDPEDLEIVERLFGEIAESHKGAVAETIIHMLARYNLSDAFDRLTKFNPDPLNETTASLLFAHPNSIPTETLERCIALKSDAARRNAVNILHARHAIDPETAGRLMTDTNREIRLTAVESLIELGEPPQEAVIKQALVMSKPRGLLGLGLNTGVPEDDSFFTRYRRARLAELGYEELLEKAEASGVFDYIEISALNDRYPRKRMTNIRRDVEDGFKGHFDAKLNGIASLLGEDSKTVTDTKALEAFLRKRLTTDGLNALCTHGSRSDIALVRKALDRFEIYFSEPALNFLARFGDWSDRNRILSIANSFEGINSILTIGSEDQAKAVGAALYAIRGSRLIDVLRLDISMAVKRAILLQMSLQETRSLTDDVLIAELNSKDDQYRKILAIKLVRAASQGRIRKLLKRYIDRDGQRYYNSVHWLDLGASMPRQVARTVAEFELAALS